MPDNVISLASKQHQPPPSTMHKCDSCGSNWFTATVCIELDLKVTGYQLPVKCLDCGTEKHL